MAELTFYFDRNIGVRVPKALRSVRPPICIKYHQEVGFPLDAPDDEWLAQVGAKGWVVVSQDRKFHQLQSELAAVQAHSVRCFYLHGGSQPRWCTFRDFICALSRMVEIANHEPAPFIYELKGRRLCRVTF